MMDAGSNSTGARNNFEKSMGSSAGLENQTQQKSPILQPHMNVHRVYSKDLDEVFAKKNPPDLNKVIT